LEAGPSGGGWGQFAHLAQGQLPMGQKQQQHGLSLPQLPGSLRPPPPPQQQQRQKALWASYAGPVGSQQQQLGGLVVGSRPMRLSSSDPGSAALRSAVATAAAAAAAAAEGSGSGGQVLTQGQGDGVQGGLWLGSQSGSGHVAVVEQQLPQLAVLRVAADKAH
jgi:hypothetical protein